MDNKNTKTEALEKNIEVSNDTVNKEKSNNLTDLIFIAVFTAIIVVMSQISIPMPSGVPMTLQTLAMPLAGIILGSKKGTISTLIYILLGAIGVPVFAGFSGGMGIILGMTGGFIVSFPLMALIAGYGMKKDSKVYLIICLILGALINFVIGMIWFSISTKTGLKESFVLSVLPFLPTAAVKILIAFWIGPILKRVLDKIKVQ